MSERPFYIVDAFTDRPFHGNPCLVVPDATGIEEPEMQAFAAELRMEAVYVLPPTRDDADIRLRFFTRREEVPMSGHGTVAVYAVLKEKGVIGSKPIGEMRRVRQETRAGVVEVDLGHDSEVGPWVTADFGRPAFGATLDRAEVIDAMRLRASELDAGHPPQVVNTRIAVGVLATVGPSTLAGIAPDMDKLVALSKRRGLLGLVVFACPGVLPGSDVCARFFFPAVKPQEDIVSGASLAAICAYGVREGILPAAEEAMYHSDQGYSLGRPNRARILVRAKGREVLNVKVRGRGVVAARGAFGAR